MKWKFFAYVKLLKNLASGYLSLWAYLLIVLIYFKIEVNVIYVIGFLIICVILTIIDWVFVFPEEQKIIWERNPAYKELRRNKNGNKRDKTLS